jgi:uncharacterized membrane protein
MLDKLFKYWSVGILPVMAVFVLSYIIAVVPHLGAIVITLLFLVGTPIFVGNIIMFEKERKDRLKARIKK